MKVYKNLSIPEIKRVLNIFTSLSEEEKQNIGSNIDISEKVEEIILSAFPKILEFSRENNKIDDIAIVNSLNTANKGILILLKNHKFISAPSKEVEELRNSQGYHENEVIQHLIQRDNTGHSKGCGCNLCKLRFFENSFLHRSKTFDLEIKKLLTAEEIIKNIEDPFSNEFFNNNIPVLIKTQANITSKINMFDNREVGYKTARLFIDLPTNEMYGPSATPPRDIVIERINKQIKFLKKKKDEYLSKHKNMHTKRLTYSQKLFLPC